MSLEISYVLSTSEDIKDVVCIAEWPVAVDENEGRKIPTKIAYLVENKTLRSNKIGFDFSNKCKSYTWTKLLLDRNAPSNQYDDVTHVIGENEGIMVLPQFQNAKEGGDNFLICDFGGGTVDISTYKVTMVVPNVEFEELCVGTGAKCGSTFLDSRLHALLFNCFGRAFKGVQYYGKGPGGDFMTQWEYAKKRFGYNMESWQDIELSRMRLDFPNSKYYNSLEHFVVLTKQDMESIFDPIVESIIGLLQRQLIEVRVHKKAKIHSVVSEVRNISMISCRYGVALMARLNFYAPRVLLRGAAIRGLEEIAPRLKYARIHYGFQIFLPFREGKYREEHAFIGEFDNDKYCEVGQIRSVIPAEFNYGVNSKSRYNPRLKKMVHLFYLQVHTIFGDRGANLKFRIAVGGRAISDATIDFPRY
ncbi:hypothetical protein SS1G_11688 [Sclerotinia sclerotiorum 1980 UF-70]|uniref:Uncharacterized protein n=1 Tax=Sclerotinia sclerotiorum (strain ATCC 18683 / 1980 / Ss-1) TaxID=665079 RepID=A7F267_SCLS1|nr:hypothetical protein SS1G_11688 [Sclerotinia sclerotiorum 1980 UF-70]EDN95809.1 hypothetical protein SS1G_11688 [Sclerotinia sclerotiorum 1980 UF-70]